MQQLEDLRTKGYDAQTKNLGIGWQCTLSWQNRIQVFTGLTESEAVRGASRYVADLERGYAKQQQRLSCEGCGDATSF